MSDLIVLDAGPLGLATNPRHSEAAARCKAWLWTMLAAGCDLRLMSRS